MDEEEVDLAMQGDKLKPCKGGVTLCLFLCVLVIFHAILSLFLNMG